MVRSHGVTMDRSVVVAIDGGGSQCRVRLTDIQGRELAAAIGGSANVQTDMAGACRTILDTIGLAWNNYGHDPDWDAHAICLLGLAGAELPEIAAATAKSLGIPRTIVVGDRETTIEGALGSGDGILALTGTGSFFARCAEGKIRVIGGWGALLGDECSGAWLGKLALQFALQAEDGLIQHSDLTHEVMAQFEGQGKALVRWAAAASPKDMAALAPKIVAADGAGDPVAARIMTQAMALYCQRLDLLQGPSDLYLAGGLAHVYQDRLPESYRRMVRPLKGSPLDGAVALALRRLEKSRAE